MINREIIRIKIVQLTYAYYQNGNKNIDTAEKELFFSLSKAYDLYNQLLSLIVAITREAQRRQEVLQAKALREGIDSHDPRTAVMAMFPYSVRWLKAGGVDTDAHPFSELTPYVAGEFSQDYANRYKKMYLLWREAAYSDHRIDDASKNKMAEFMKDTSEMIKEKFTYTDKLRVMLKYSL